jgi:uncharacterized protein (DUF1697 family)
MKTHIALLRGINVSGKKKFPKADQLAMLTNLGFENPQVYIHTGNWVFSSEKPVTDISTLISERITKSYGWEVPIVVISASEFKDIVENCPFPEEKKIKSYFTLLAKTPIKEDATLFQDFSFPEEEFHLAKRCIYSFSTISAARVKMNNNFMERKLKVSATSRNYNTMAKLLELSNS